MPSMLNGIFGSTGFVGDPFDPTTGRMGGTPQYGQQQPPWQPPAPQSPQTPNIVPPTGPQQSPQWTAMLEHWNKVLADRATARAGQPAYQPQGGMGSFGPGFTGPRPDSGRMSNPADKLSGLGSMDPSFSIPGGYNGLGRSDGGGFGGGGEGGGYNGMGRRGGLAGMFGWR